MRTIPQAWRQEYIKGNRKYDVTVNMTLADGTTLTIENDQIWEGGFSYEQASSSDSSFDIGSAVIGSATLVLDNINENFSEYDFFNAEFNVSVGLVGTNLQHITIGHFTVDETSYNGSLITLTCLDNMWRFDRPFSEITTVSYPATARSIINAMCAYSGIGIQLATQSFQGYDYAINSAPEEDMTCREVLQYVAQATCNYCVINQQGNLELRWYDKSAINNITDYDGGSFSTNTTPYSDGDTVDGGTFAFNDGDNIDGGSFYEPSSIAYITSNYSMSVDTDDIVITGVKVCTSDTESEEGYDYSWHDSTLEQTHPRYTLIIQDNPFINKNNASSRATTIGGIIAGTPLRGFSSSSLSDISIEVGDPCAIIDFRGNRFYSFVTNTRFQTSNAESFSCGVESLTQNKTVRYSNEIKTLVEAKRNAQEVVSDYDQSVQRMHQLAANAGGLYWLEVPQQDGSVIWYESDMPLSLDSSGNVVFTNQSHAWKRTANGFFSCTSTGTSEATTTWTAGIDNNNNAVMNTVSAIGINADWINAGSLNAARITAGILKDQYNYNYWNLNTGEFKLAALPAEIRVNVDEEDANYHGAYVPTNSNLPASGWTTSEAKKQHVGETFKDTSSGGKTYIYKAIPTPLPESEHNPYSDNVDQYYHFSIFDVDTPVLNFNPQCATEGNNYDYVDLYEGEGAYWSKLRLQGNTSLFGAKSVAVNNEFWLHWHTDTSQHNYYGWKIDSISSSGGEYLNWEDVSGLPSVTWTDITYPTTPTYQWVEATLEEYIDSKTQEQEQEDLTQEEIFNILTDNLQNQGLFLRGNKLYINGEMFATNALMIGKNPNTGYEPYLQIFANDGTTEIGRWDKNGIEANAGKFGKLHVFTDSGNNQTYLRYVTTKTYKYIDKSWSAGTNSKGTGYFAVNPYKEGWTEDGYVDFNFYRNVTGSTTQCTVTVYRYTNGTRGLVKTNQLRGDGNTSGGVKGLNNVLLDHTVGENDGDYYWIKYTLTSSTKATTLEANDGGKGSSFVIRENGSAEATCIGKFLGEFKGQGTFNTLDLGCFKYNDGDKSSGFFTIDNNSGNNYGELSWSQFSLSDTPDFNDCYTGLRIQKDDLSQVHEGNWRTVEWVGSDRRIKNDIQPIPIDLSVRLIDGTETKSFKYKNATVRTYGMIAQEARELLDSLGETDTDLEYSMGNTNIPDQRNINYTQYIPHLINYVKDLRSEIDELKEEIRTLKGDSE